MVSNITASFFIAIWRPFRLGDTIENPGTGFLFGEQGWRRYSEWLERNLPKSELGHLNHW
jgi:hypothetical protein